MNFITKEGIKLVNIGPEDIADGNVKIILGLIWTLILRYQIATAPGSSARQELLEWVRSKVGQNRVNNFSTDWNDGTLLCELINALDPNARLAPKGAPLANAALGINTAQQRFEIPPVLSPEDMTNPELDELSCMTYISYFRDVRPQDARADASQVKAHGPGLQPGNRSGEPAQFKVENPQKQGKLKVWVEGPTSEAEVHVKHNAATGVYDVEYRPKEPGIYKVNVTLDDQHVPGSVFTVVIEKELSLGGEGKIRVYYSTTTSQAKVRQDTQNLQRLLADKSVHLRPDFEPWIPVDVMTPEQRSMVWAKAGHRRLPMVFINDHYIGDYDTCVDLENRGHLDDLISYSRLGDVQLALGGNTGPSFDHSTL